MSQTKAKIIFVVHIKKQCSLVFQKEPSEDSDSRNAQGDLNLRWVKMSEGSFPDVAPHMVFDFFSEPLIHKSFDNILVPRFHFNNKEYEIIDLRDSTGSGPDKSRETHIIIDRSVNSMIKLRSKSLEIDIPPNIPTLEVSPPTPENDKSADVHLPDIQGDAQQEQISNNCNDENNLQQDKLFDTKVSNDDSNATSLSALDQENVEITETYSSQGLDNTETIDLDENAENQRMYGFTVVLNGTAETTKKDSAEDCL